MENSHISKLGKVKSSDFVVMLCAMVCDMWYMCTVLEYGVQFEAVAGVCSVSLCEKTSSYGDSMWSWTFALKNALEEEERGLTSGSLATFLFCTLAMLFCNVTSLFGYKNSQI